MSVSLIMVSVLILMVMFGAGQKILDNMRLSDKEALIILILICIGLIIPPIWIGEYFCFSIGGFLIPLAISIYLLISCGISRDLIRCILGSILTAGIIYGLQWLLPAEPEKVLIDNSYIYGIVAGLVAYVLGRSRRNAFVVCLFGLTLVDLVQWLVNFSLGTPTILGLGVGGAFGTYVVAIVISVALCEFIGRIFESVSIEKNDKKFNFETHQYDSKKNGRIDEKENVELKRLNQIANIKNAKNSKNTRKNTRKTSKGVKNEK